MRPKVFVICLSLVLILPMFAISNAGGAKPGNVYQEVKSLWHLKNNVATFGDFTFYSNSSGNTTYIHWYVGTAGAVGAFSDYLNITKQSSMFVIWNGMANPVVISKSNNVGYINSTADGSSDLFSYYIYAFLYPLYVPVETGVSLHNGLFWRSYLNMTSNPFVSSPVSNLPNSTLGFNLDLRGWPIFLLYGLLPLQFVGGTYNLTVTTQLLYPDGSTATNTSIFGSGQFTNPVSQTLTWNYDYTISHYDFYSASGILNASWQYVPFTLH